MNTLFSYKKAFAATQVAMITISVLSIAFAALVYLYSMNEIAIAKEKIYVLDRAANISTAYEDKIVSGREHEYRNHIRRFYGLWYGLDENCYKTNISMATNLISKEQWEILSSRYKDMDLHKQLVVQNMQLLVEIKKIEINTQTRPVEGIIEGVQIKSVISGKAARNMVCRFQLIDVSRTDENPHGVLIVAWDEINNSPVVEQNN